MAIIKKGFLFRYSVLSYQHKLSEMCQRIPNFMKLERALKAPHHLQIIFLESTFNIQELVQSQYTKKNVRAR